MVDPPPLSAPIIAVVGVCASGKSSLVQGLRSHGWNARQVLQEHSYAPTMWQRITNPDILIYLHCSLAMTRRRRNSPEFPEWIYEAERIRLRHAREHCHLYIDTDLHTTEEILALVLDFLARLPADSAGD